MLLRSLGVCRALSSTCTITSYCSEPRLKRVTLRPPIIVSTVRPTSATELPTMLIFSRFTDTRSRSEEHTSELQSLMRISYAVFCLKNKQHPNYHIIYYTTT